MLKVEFVICRRMQMIQTVSACQDVCARDHKNEKSRLMVCLQGTVHGWLPCSDQDPPLISLPCPPLGDHQNVEAKNEIIMIMIIIIIIIIIIIKLYNIYKKKKICIQSAFMNKGNICF